MQRSSLLSNIIALWKYLGKRRRAQFIVLFFLMLASVLAEVVSIGAVIPFLSALTAPDVLMHTGWAQPAVKIFWIQSADELLLPLTLSFVAAAVSASGMRIFQLWFNFKLTADMGTQLRSDIYRITLNQSYEFHVAHNSSELISLTTEKVGAAIGAGIMQSLLLLTGVVMSSAIIGTLFCINAFIALSAFIILGGGYVLTGYLVRKRIQSNSVIIAENQPLSVKCMQEGLGGIREVILDNSQEVFSSTYMRTVKNIQYAALQNTFLGWVPKSLLEVIGITLIAALAYSLQINAAAQQNVFPMLGAFALGAHRLLPSLQQIFFSWSTIQGNQVVLADVVASLYTTDSKQDTPDKPVDPVHFNNNLVVRDVSFQYSGSDKKILQSIQLDIRKGFKIGFIGATGSGKSTLLDIIMGLLPPTQGRLRVDGVGIDQSNVRAWQKNIAHVSQSIFLSDASMAENIAFGVPRDKVDLEQVKRAAKSAQIDIFIETLPESYQTLVGERGVRLSGGQRQRIGIARALYKQAGVLILDEATSALDGKTEKAVMKAIHEINDDLTLLIIAHRLSTLEGCDCVVELAQGKIIREGKYADMIGQTTRNGRT